jgi:ABC-type molybdate transport system ATPase subunit
MVSDALVRVAAETGAGILVVEHKLDVLAGIADEVVVLEGGKVALAGDAATVLADPRLVGFGVDPPAGIGLEGAVRAAGLEWTPAMAEAIR